MYQVKGTVDTLLREVAQLVMVPCTCKSDDEWICVRCNGSKRLQPWMQPCQVIHVVATLAPDPDGGHLSSCEGVGCPG